jgi:hypothetical protein
MAMMTIPAIKYQLIRREAIKAAAVVGTGWGRDPATDNKLSPEEHWAYREKHYPPTANQAAIEITTEIIEAYEKVMKEHGLL